MSWLNAIYKYITLILIALFLRSAFASDMTSSEPLSTEISFYDLLAKKREVYQLQLTPKPSTSNYYVSLTNSAEPTITIHGILHKTLNSLTEPVFDFSAIAYQHQTPLLIDSFIDYAYYHHLNIVPLLTENEVLMISQNGMLLFMPGNFKFSS